MAANLLLCMCCVPKLLSARFSKSVSSPAHVCMLRYKTCHILLAAVRRNTRSFWASTWACSFTHLVWVGKQTKVKMSRVPRDRVAWSLALIFFVFPALFVYYGSCTSPNNAKYEHSLVVRESETAEVAPGPEPDCYFTRQGSSSFNVVVTVPLESNSRCGTEFVKTVASKVWEFTDYKYRPQTGYSWDEKAGICTATFITHNVRLLHACLTCYLPRDKFPLNCVSFQFGTTFLE